MDVDDSTRPSLPVLSPLPNVGLIVDVGRQRRKHIKRLKRGMGRISTQVEAAAEEARGELRIGPDTEIIPVVPLYDVAVRVGVIAPSVS
jgi:hypothetical protein